MGHTDGGDGVPADPGLSGVGVQDGELVAAGLAPRGPDVDQGGAPGQRGAEVDRTGLAEARHDDAGQWGTRGCGARLTGRAGLQIRPAPHIRQRGVVRGRSGADQIGEHLWRRPAGREL
jgi:hypothetical protein